MRFDVDGNTILVDVENESSFSSRHTNATLRRIEVSFVARGTATQERILDLLQTARKTGLASVDEHGNKLTRWKVEHSSYSHRSGPADTNYYHRLELIEMEVLMPEHLVVGELALHPYSYQEEFDDDALIVECRIRISEEQSAQLKKLMRTSKYFPVIRRGISETPLEMRFGTTFWSQHGSQIKHELVLVQKSYDEGRQGRRDPTEAIMRRMRQVTAEYVEIMEGLIGMLVGKGLITVEEASEIRSAAAERNWDRRVTFCQVADIDE